MAEPDVRVQSENQIVVQIPGVKNPEEVIRMIGSTAQLGFYQVLAADPQLERPCTDEIDADQRRDQRRTSKGTTLTRRGRRRSSSRRALPYRAVATDVNGYVVNEDPDMTGDALKQNGANVEFDQTRRASAS